MMFDWSRVVRVDSVVSPVSLALAKLHVGQSSDADDEIIRLYVDAATEFIEGPNGAGICMASQQWDYFLDVFPYEIEIGIGPLVSVDSITYTDENGTPGQTVASSVYEVDAERGLIRSKEGQSWPTVDTIYKAITIRFTAGYTNVPVDLQRAVLSIAAHGYEFREEAVAGTIITQVPMAAQNVIERYRRGRFV